MLFIPLLFVTTALASPLRECTTVFDGRVPANWNLKSFDDPSSIYNNAYILGINQSFSEVLKLPSTPPSLFHTRASRPVEVTINDNSVFLAGGVPQVGFRRTELLPGTNNGTDASVQGVKTFHFSFRTDPTRPLNYSHEYHLLWHETNDYSTSEWVLQTGTPFSSAKDPGVDNPRTIRLTGRQSETPEDLIWTTAFTPNVWHNMALTVGWETNIISVFYSQGRQPLRRVVKSFANDNSGGGQFHFGVFKLPTGPDGIDVAHEGYQPTGINEGIIWDGVFIEDSSDGCVTLF